MAFERYREFVRRIYPTVLNGQWGERLSGVVSGLLFDLVAEGLSLAAHAGWLSSEDQPDDALDAIARERSLAKYLDETISAWSARLRSAWAIWERAGNGDLIEEQLAAALYVGSTVHSPLDWSRTPLAHPSQFWIFLPPAAHQRLPGALFGPGAIAGAAIAGTHLCGLSGPEERVAELRYIAANFRSAQEVCRQIIISLSGSTCGPGLIAGSHTCGGSSVAIGTSVQPI